MTHIPTWTSSTNECGRHYTLTTPENGSANRIEVAVAYNNGRGGFTGRIVFTTETGEVVAWETQHPTAHKAKQAVYWKVVVKLERSSRLPRSLCKNL